MGVSSERLGFDKDLRANTVRERTHSLFRQGRELLGEVSRDIHTSLSEEFAAILNCLISKSLIDVFS